LLAPNLSRGYNKIMHHKPRKICFIGGPSTGKTTLARYLAEELARNNHSAKLVDEFARDYIAEGRDVKEPEVQLAMVRGQKERERMAYGSSPEFVVCDAASFLCHVYFHFLNDGVIDKDEAEILKRVEEKLWQEIEGEINTYDFVFFLPVEFTPKEDGVRIFIDQVGEISERIEKFLKLHDIKYHELRGTVEERAAVALKVICTK
jgi:HTH-type transcriptional regulator, transcriptional repressor of NAD biosynthesis genes